MHACIHYIPFHSIPFHYITLHYISLHYITLHYIHIITLHYITLHYIHIITYPRLMNWISLLVPFVASQLPGKALHHGELECDVHLLSGLPADIMGVICRYQGTLYWGYYWGYYIVGMLSLGCIVPLFWGIVEWIWGNLNTVMVRIQSGNHPKMLNEQWIFKSGLGSESLAIISGCVGVKSSQNDDWNGIFFVFCVMPELFGSSEALLTLW